MITQLHLRNFKAFETLDLSLKPITLLLGPNNSGKSSLLAPLRLLVQTMESHDTAIPLLLNGILGDFGTYKDLVYGNHRGRPFEIGLSIAPQGPPPLKPSTTVDFSLEYKHRTKRRETILRTAHFHLDDDHIASLEYSLGSERHLISKLRGIDIPSSLKSPLAELLSVRHFLPYIYTYRSRDSEGKLPEFLERFDRRDLRLPNYVSQAIFHQLEQIDYLGAMRSPPQRTYLFTGETRRRIGSAGQHAASLFMLDEMRGGSKEEGLAQKTSKWLRRAGIADSVEVEMLSDRHYELRITHPSTREKQNISDVGFGNSQVFPVVIGGYRLTAGQLYLVEEPEIHLHPRAEAELGYFFADLYDRGVQSVVETHSEHLVIRLQQYVAEGIIDPNDLAVYYVYADHEQAVKTVAHLRLDEAGRFIDEWPEGFFPQRLNEAKRLAQIRHTAASERERAHAGSNRR